MPGFSSECVSGAHPACMTPDCRCQCHPATQALMRAPKKRGDARGGVRRNLKKQISEAVTALPAIDVVPEEEVRNTCPKCGTHAKPTDTYCRKDGSKLCLGKSCQRCTAPCEEADSFCWQCGWNLAEKIPEAPPLSLDLPNEAASAPKTKPAEDPIVRLKRIAMESGLLKETVVS